MRRAWWILAGAIACKGSGECADLGAPIDEAARALEALGPGAQPAASPSARSPGSSAGALRDGAASVERLTAALSARRIADSPLRARADAWRDAAPGLTAAARELAGSLDEVTRVRARVEESIRSVAAAEGVTKDAVAAWSKECGKDCAAVSAALRKVPAIPDDLPAFADSLEKLPTVEPTSPAHARAVAKALRAQADAERDASRLASEAEGLTRGKGDVERRLQAARDRLIPIARDLGTSCPAP